MDGNVPGADTPRSPNAVPAVEVQATILVLNTAVIQTLLELRFVRVICSVSVWRERAPHRPTGDKVE